MNHENTNGMKHGSCVRRRRVHVTVTLDPLLLQELKVLMPALGVRDLSRQLDQAMLLALPILRARLRFATQLIGHAGGGRDSVEDAPALMPGGPTPDPPPPHSALGGRGTGGTPVPGSVIDFQTQTPQPLKEQRR